MAASPAIPNSKASPPAHRSAGVMQPAQPLVVRTDVHAMPTGMGSRSVRRRTTPEAGFALEILGHAIEYLADEYVHEAGLLPSIHSGDPRMEAIQLLMAANRQVYYSCPVVPPLYRRVMGRLFGQ
jgi:hypothetical protein